MELWDLYSSDREKLGKTMVRGDVQPEGTYRTVVHVCLFNTEGKMLIQQRQPFKSGWSNLWDVTVGGSAVSGDSSRDAAERELFEELGIKQSFADLRPALTVHFDWGFDDFYVLESDVDLSSVQLQYEEVQAVRWADMEEIVSMLSDGSFIPYHKSFIELLFLLRKQRSVRTGSDTTVPQPRPTDIQ